MTEEFSHINADGSVKMVDVSDKRSTERVAIAEGFVIVGDDIVKRLADRTTPKGNPLDTARIASIFAAKRTSELIPLCHQLPLDNVSIDFEVMKDRIRVTARVKTHATTGVEMEALTAVSVASLTVYDMLKALSKEIVIDQIHLVSKTGGKSGDYHAMGNK